MKIELGSLLTLQIVLLLTHLGGVIILPKMLLLLPISIYIGINAVMIGLIVLMLVMKVMSKG